MVQFSADGGLHNHNFPQLMNLLMTQNSHNPGYAQRRTQQMELERLRAHAGYSALHRSARDGKVDTVVDLLRDGADKDALDTFGATPLMHAVEEGHLAVVNTLLNSEADVTLVCDRDDGIGGECNALHLATYGRHLGVVNALLSKGADKDWRGAYGMTALMIAARNSDLPIVRCLLAKGADVDALDHHGESALILALDEFRSDRAPIPEVVETLLAGGTGANVGRTMEGEYTPLGLAAAKGDISAMIPLIAYGAGVNTPDCYGYTPLHVACEDCVDLAVVDFLLRSGADETATDKDGKTPADLIDESDPEAEAVRLLLARAPTDRAWRRRGWLVMLRSRTLKARAAGGDGGSSGSSGDGGDGGAAGARSVKQRGGAGGGKERFDLSAAVEWLGGVEEGVFRNVVGFL